MTEHLSGVVQELAYTESIRLSVWVIKPLSAYTRMPRRGGNSTIELPLFNNVSVRNRRGGNKGQFLPELGIEPRPSRRLIHKAIVSPQVVSNGDKYCHSEHI